MITLKLLIKWLWSLVHPGKLHIQCAWCVPPHHMRGPKDAPVSHGMCAKAYRKHTELLRKITGER